MKRLVVALALAGAGVFGVGELGDLTQSRPDPVQTDTRTEMVISIDDNGYGPGEAAAADALWAVCAAQISARPTGEGLHPVGSSSYRIVLEPAVGHHDQLKLTGCLEDLTIDRVLGDVESFRTVPITDFE